jgi:mannose-6-phosphate isomerase-like protein (cupin superfamily)
MSELNADRLRDLPPARAQSADPSRTLDWGPLFGRWVFTRTTADTDGAYLEAHVLAPAGDGPPLHVHHHAEESYQIRSGTLEVRLGQEWKQVRAGETLTVPRGTPHTLRNSAPVELINIHRPALDIEHMFRTLHCLVTEHRVTLPPKDVRSAVLVGMLFTEYERENTTVQPPVAVLRGLARIGRLLRFRLPQEERRPADQVARTIAD